MEKDKSELNLGTGNRIALVSEYNGLAVLLAEKLLANFCRVNIFCVNSRLWLEKAPYLKENSFLNFIDLEDLENISFDGLIFVSRFFDNLNGLKKDEIVKGEKERLERITNFLKVRKKRFFLLPYAVFEEKGKALAEIYSQLVESQKSGNFIFYLGDLVGPRLVLTSRSAPSFILRSFILKEPLVTVLLPASEKVRPTPLILACRYLISFLLTETELFPRNLIAGKEISLKKWTFLVNQVFKGKTKVSFEANRSRLLGVYDHQFPIEETVDQKILRETKDWFERNRDSFYAEFETELNYNEKIREAVEPLKGSTFPKKIKNTPSRFFRRFRLPQVRFSFHLPRPKVSKKVGFSFPAFSFTKTSSFFSKFSSFSKLPRFLVFLASLFLTLFLVPLGALFLSGLFLYIGGSGLKKNFFITPSSFFYFSEKTAQFASPQFYFYASLLGGEDNFFQDLARLSQISAESAETMSVVADIGDKVISLFRQSFAGEEVALADYSSSLNLELDSVYQKASFLEGELKEVKNLWPFVYFSDYINRLDLTRRREEIQAAEIISSSLKDLLGGEGEKNYLVLFQNNMELRPTGGFIGSFAILSFKKGALSNLEVYDVYTADGQLKGYVEPPWQLKTYLDQPAWYLRDSNWDPDFFVSAQRAEWFLDKSLGIRVDGVVGIDLSLVKNLVGVLGSLYIADYDKKIDAGNFYEVVQYEAEKDFFPGSRQKENFLLALSRSLLEGLKSADKNQLLATLESSYQALDERHLQLFIHNSPVQTKIELLGWGGLVKEPECFGDNCLADWVAPVEANLGVNKANYFIDRSVRFEVNFEEDNLIRRLELDFSNKAQSFLGDKAKYKNYLRFLLPPDVEVKEILVGQGNNLDKVNFDQEFKDGRKEIGLWLEIGASESKKVILVWEGQKKVDFTKNGEYRISFRKQAGIDFIPFTFRASFPNESLVAADSFYPLTKADGFVYNQEPLRTDFSVRFYW